MNNLIIQFRGMIFEGLKFKGSNKYSDEYFENLLKEDNHYNRVKYKDAVAEQIDEQIHIKISSSILLVILSYFSMFISITSAFNHAFISSIIILTFGFFSHLLHRYSVRRANEYFAGKQMSKDLVDVIYESTK